MIYDTIIIGRGPAGLTAGIYASRFKLKNLIIGKEAGTLALAPMVANWPGEEAIGGKNLLQKIEAHAKKLGSEIIIDQIVGIKKDSTFTVSTEGGLTHQAKSVILALGTQHRLLNIPGEQEFQGKGVSYCATCDAPLFKDKIVAVVGGGDSGIKTALLLAKYAREIHLLVRDPAMKAEPTNQEVLKKESKIKIHLQSEPSEIKGKSNIESIILKNGETIPVQGVFVAIGQVPSSQLAQGIGVQIDNKGYIIINEDFSTNIPGVFAAGDVTVYKSGVSGFKQALIASAAGASAINSAYAFLRTQKK